jgi:hypothetical protein
MFDEFRNLLRLSGHWFCFGSWLAAVSTFLLVLAVYGYLKGYGDRRP